MQFNMNDRINEIMQKREKINSLGTHTVKETTVTKDNKTFNVLSSDAKPSEYLPIRTANFWQDVNAGQTPDINFYKYTANSVEIHKNATRGFEKVVDLSALHQVLKETEFELSYDGESDIALFRQENQIVPLKIDLVRKQYFPNGELQYYHGIVNMDQGTAPWIMTKKFYYENDNVIMENTPIVSNTNAATGATEWRYEDVRTINNKYGLDLQEKVNLGQIPFPVITMTNTGGDRYGSGKADTVGIEDVLARLDTIENAIDRSIKTAKTRLLEKKKNGSMNLGNQDTQSSQVKQIADDVDVLSFTEDPHLDGEGQVQVVDRQLNVNEWYMARKTALNEYYSHTGENVAADAHGNNQHTYEVQSKGDNKYRRGTAKRIQRQQEIASLVQMIIDYAKNIGYSDFAGLDKISVNINEVDIRKEYELEEKVEKLMGLGLMSKVQAVMKLHGVDEETAMVFVSNMERHNKMFEVEDDKQVKKDTKVSEETKEVSEKEQQDTPENTGDRE